MTCIVQTYNDYLQQYDADKTQEGLQIDLSFFTGDYKGVKIWENDGSSCFGPDIDLLNLSGDDRKRIYKNITEYKGNERSAIFGKLTSNLEALRNAGWFTTGYTDYERTVQDEKVEWCSKGLDSRHCISAAEYLKLRSYFDLLDSTAQIIVEELKTR